MKKTNITLSIALAAVFSSSVAFAEAEVTGKIVHESAKFTTSGIGIGAATTMEQTANSHGKDVFKTETSARIYIDGEAEAMHEGATYHVELNLMRDSKGVDKYDGNESYTQRDALREAYVDTEVNDWSIRAGKQQVVWGTADGMKLLDAINPTDYSEMAQNQMEDSRIPVWMINAETDLEEGGNVQLIVSESKSNKIAGLGIASGSATSHTNGNAGNAFIMKGVDSITGKVNGFVNVGPALGKTATFFAKYAGGGTIGGATGGAYALRTYSTTRVHDYVNDITVKMDGSDSSNEWNSAAAGYTLETHGYGNELDFRATCNEANGGTSTLCEAIDLNYVTQTSEDVDSKGVGGSNADVTNLIDATDTAHDSSASNTPWDTTNPNSMFEYMDNTTFGTFAAFADMETEYRVKDNNTPTTGLRYKGNTTNGLNYSLNYIHGPDANPHVNLHWEDASAGTLLYACEEEGTRSAVTAVTAGGATTSSTKVTQVSLNTSSGCASGTKHKYENDGAARLVFDEERSMISNLGSSFDMAIDTKRLGPVVLRGEFLYKKDVKTPIINKAKLDIGNIVEALKMENANYFNYVLGADITLLTNMMVSAQFIQERNLDFVDETVNATTTNTDVTGARYTADRAAMHLTNGLQKAEENKEFYSLFFSKPFGASGEHRWNNIFMFEENGGKWNRCLSIIIN